MIKPLFNCFASHHQIDHFLIIILQHISSVLSTPIERTANHLNKARRNTRLHLTTYLISFPKTLNQPPLT